MRFALSLFSFTLLALVLGCVPFVHRTVRGPLNSDAEWPESIVLLSNRLKESDPNTQTAGYLLVGKPGRHSIECAIFKVSNVTPEIFEIASDQLKLVATADDLHRKWWHRDGIKPPPTNWWTSDSSESAKPFACQNRLRGEEGDLYYASYDSEEQELFIEYYFNF